MIFNIEVHTTDRVIPLLCDEASGYKAELKAEDDITITELRAMRGGDLVYQTTCHRLIQAGKSLTVNLLGLAILYSAPDV